ncbi:uncharacterized protein LTR77_003780 [Saxophila tyrrhenica]|uniref:GDP-mannose transporter n=1 Tax=Saxophila tyrrhenica TaxID=1690608 RepID=A0AAV9PIV0_9PEZI|nr:hypothetical protein LTR77_003780 [Saxophila tyrrhenica]
MATGSSSKEALEENEDHYVDAEEKGFLSEESHPSTPPKERTSLGPRFWLSAGINTGATAAIIFVNKHIFETQSLRHAQVTFAAFHFAVTSALLFLVSRPSIAMFSPKRVHILRILPLALGMIFNVVLPNASLAYSSIQFYQIMRVLVTPCVCALNFMLLGQATPRVAAATLVPVCVGVGFMSYFDTVPTGGAQTRGTTPLGVVFAFAGVFATAVYTVWIKKYHAALECTSMQLLLNQAQVSVLAMLYIVPFADDVTVWHDVGGSTILLILFVSTPSTTRSETY